MKSRYSLAAALLGLALPAFAQTIPALSNAATKVQQSAAAKNSALDSFKAGDAAAGLATLRADGKAANRSTAQEVQVAGDLCSIARALSIGGFATSQSTAALAAAEIAKARLKTSGRDAAYLDVLAADLYENILGDQEKARQFYQSALAQNPNRKDAEEGLKRIARLQALLQARAQENTALRSKGK